ncbi:MAG TPA: DUF86 domain-containing protein [Anaerolineae bacterium]|nr:DUF86 domain-containing protein [Anaerolineae bacterium]
MIDVETILERLDALQEYVDKLRPMQSLTPEDMQDENRYVEYWAVQRGLELATQCVLDISSHLVAGLRLGHPQEYRQAILLLGQHKVLPSEFAEHLSQIAGFRNIIVHDYLDIDPILVHRAVTIGLDDLETFAEQIIIYLRQEGYLAD